MPSHLSYKDGHLSLNITELLSGLKEEALADLIDALACHESIIDDVASQIIGGYTKLGSHGYRMCASLGSGTALERARALIAESSSQCARDEIDRLRRMVESECKLGEDGWRQYHELLRRNDTH